MDFHCRVISVLVRAYARTNTRQWKSTLKEVPGNTELTSSVGKVNIYEKMTSCASLVCLGLDGLIVNSLDPFLLCSFK